MPTADWKQMLDELILICILHLLIDTQHLLLHILFLGHIIFMYCNVLVELDFLYKPNALK